MNKNLTRKRMKKHTVLYKGVMHEVWAFSASDAFQRLRKKEKRQ